MGHPRHLSANAVETGFGSWCRPYGTRVLFSSVYPGLTSGLCCAAPSGLVWGGSCRIFSPIVRLETAGSSTTPSPSLRSGSSSGRNDNRHDNEICVGDKEICSERNFPYLLAFLSGRHCTRIPC